LTTVIMAGGKSSRMGPRIEKALLKIGRETLLERTVAAIRKSTAGDIIVATTPATPKTGKFAVKLGLAVLETPGKDYVDDVYFLLDKFKSYLSVNVDIPFMNPEAIDLLLSKVKRKSIACVLLKESVNYPVSEDSVGKDEEGKEVIWIGLNYVTPTTETDLLVMDDELLAININTPFDLAMALKIEHDRKRKRQD
jgi:adenosylcobinamide-phosphate guanylyltransferase